MFKHGLIKDVSYFELLSQKRPQDTTRAEFADFVIESVTIKAAIVMNDERESGERKLINFGHTVGHAVEAQSWETDSPLLHGEAIAIGMVVEAELSRREGMLSEEDVQRIRRVLSAAGLPITVPHLAGDLLLAKMRLDKKNEHGVILFTLLKHIGEAVYDQTVEEDSILQTIAENMEPADER